MPGIVVDLKRAQQILGGLGITQSLGGPPGAWLISHEKPIIKIVSLACKIREIDFRRELHDEYRGVEWHITERSIARHILKSQRFDRYDFRIVNIARTK